MGDAGMIGAFEVKDHGGARPLADELVEQIMVGFRGTPRRKGGGVYQVEAAGIAQEYGGAKGLILFVEYRPGHELVLLVQAKAERFESAKIIFLNSRQA